MKKNYLLLAFAAIMMSIGAYSLINTKNVSALMSLKGVEALAGNESDGSENRYAPSRYQAECCDAWELVYTDSQGIPHYHCVRVVLKDCVKCVVGNTSCSVSSPC